MRVSGYTAADGELTVHFTGGVCSDYAAEARESGGKVTVTVTETPHPDKVCILIAKEYERTVPLDEPLGDRTVVGSDGKDIPVHKPGARLPAPSGGPVTSTAGADAAEGRWPGEESPGHRPSHARCRAAAPPVS
ncbi:hypothetical protein SVIOM342S_01432 [Streptomyces violaceorubidus]